MTYQRDYPHRVRVGVVGVGMHAYRNLLPTLTHLPVELVALADHDRDRALATAAQYGVVGYGSASEMYASESLDAVLLCVSPQMHPVLALEAIAAGLHVWMEKPVATTVRQVDELIAARRDRVVMVGYKKAFMPATVKARELMARDEMQPLRAISAIYPLDIPLGDRSTIEAGEHSQWLANGCHPVSLLLALGGRPESVTVHRGPDNGGTLLLRHVGGALSTLVLAHGAPRFQPFERCLVLGGSASVEIVNSRRVVFQRGIDLGASGGVSFAPQGLESGAIVWEAQDGYNTFENKAIVTQGMYGELLHFAECVLDGRSPDYADLEFARDVTAVYEAAVLSDESTVKL